MANPTPVLLRSSSPRCWHHLGMLCLSAYHSCKKSTQFVLVILTLLVSSVAVSSDQPFEQAGNVFYFPSYAAALNQNVNSLTVNLNAGGQATYNYKRITESGEATKMDGNAVLRETGEDIPMTINGHIFYIKALEVVNNGGTISVKNESTGAWDYVSPHGSNLVSDFQNQYINWIGDMRGAGYPTGISAGSFLAFLQGLSNPGQDSSHGQGGTPGPTVNNPQGGSASSTTTGNSTTTATSGNATVTQNNSTTYNYTYTTNVTNNNGGGSGDGGTTNVDLSPVVSAVNAAKDQAHSDAAAIKQEIHDDSQVVANKIDGLHTDLTAHGDSGDNPLDGATSTALTGAASTAANGKFGALHSAMSIAGGGAASFTVGIPFPTGTVNYTISSMPESGSAFDTFRIILRAFFTVLIGIAFVVCCVKTFRFY